MYLGDFIVGDTIYFKFTTRQFSTGAPFALASGVLSAYEDDSVTQITAGITLTASFDSVTGLNGVVIVASGANGFEAGKQYDIVITTGTVDSVSVVGEVVGRFSLEADSSYVRLGAPAGASVSADIAAVKVDTAAILVDTAEIGAAGAGLTAINLPNQTMDITGNITGNLSGSVGSVTGAVGSVTAGVTLAAAAIQAIWDALTSALTTAGSIGKLIVDNLNATISSRASQTSLDTLDDFVDTEVAAIKAKTDNLPSDPADASVIAAAFAVTDGLVTTVDTVVDAIKLKTDNLPADPADASDIAASFAALNNISTAQVNTEVLDVLSVDTFAEPTGVPAATATLAVKIGRIHQALRNRLDVTSTKKTLYDDANAALWEKDLSDDGTTYSESEGNAI